MNQRKPRPKNPKGSSGSSASRKLKHVFYRGDILLVTDKKRTHMQDLRHRRRTYNLIQAARIPLLALAGICWMVWGYWWLAGIIFIISIPLPWIAVVIANAQGQPRDPREKAVYKPGVARQLNQQAELEARRVRELDAAPAEKSGGELDIIRDFDGITIDADDENKKDDKNDR
ncbi:DUF3099 domain-containing protein [uncultured Corynebacterium sp.]|uniref:DUF3099 domain-containing protein n=1 Tax=uncultured Corynebacterium sp. TaxID=159447 RepID=UPI0025E8B11B|nr:DUF3099 domain-containing protein [uncultured Corynebacterium sp.]